MLSVAALFGLAFQAPGFATEGSVRSRGRATRIVCESRTATQLTAQVMPPGNKREMIRQAIKAVDAARSDGVSRFTLRLFLEREGELTPADESWEGGIMQLFRAASPLARDLLRALSSDIAGVVPALTEQRLDKSGVDGESVWMAQSSRPQDDAVCFVQPSTEVIKQVSDIAANAGPRPVLLMNPQWKERDDPLDALSRKGGLLGSLGSFLGGKAATEATLENLGFVDVYTLAQYRCRGSIIYLQLAYPNGWQAFYREGVEDDDWKPLIVGSSSRPTYQEVEEALKDAGVPFRLTEFDSIV